MSPETYSPSADSTTFSPQGSEQSRRGTQTESNSTQVTPETCQVRSTIHSGDIQIDQDAAHIAVVGDDSTTSEGGMSIDGMLCSTRTLGSRVRMGSDTIDERVMNLVSFVGCEELRRGSPLSVILSKQAKIFSDSSGSAETYALSRPTQIIDAFISHNWSVPRWQKWFCLLLQFNVSVAAVWTCVIMSPFYVLAIRGDLPITRPEFAPYPRSYFFRVTMLPVFMIILFFYRDIKRCLFTRFFSVPDPIVFLDKTCINQEDKQSQRMGIEKLGAFLCYSKKMVVCYTDVYLQKLWTVYEVASFISLQPYARMKVIPVMFPILIISCLVFFYLANLIALWVELAIHLYYTAHITHFVIGYCVLVAFRKWSKSKRDIYKKVASFDVRNCTCLCEADRPVVYKNIAALMKVTSDIGDDAGEDVALAAFDRMVRDNLAYVLISSVGKYAMHYEQTVAMCGIYASKVLDQLVGFAHGMSLREYLNYALWYACISGFVVPSVLTGFSVWADRCTRLTGWSEYLYLALGLVVVYAPVMIVHVVLDILEIWANESDLGEVVFVLVCLILSALVRMIMNEPPCQKVCGKKVGRTKPMRISMEDLDMAERVKAQTLATSVGKVAENTEVPAKDLHSGAAEVEVERDI